ncbi:hypothetical protein MSAN_01928300 [Mycena sanguinolenta]|uniref:Uncharacterized protein n=1 Tax=Mycena sanguinolenta TaxID=230812 RepID=A0A8H6XQ44_9AGAR|nr:hypothetical protein MSAN_01928300 [Mycena sanguinolenta]
MMLVQKQPLFSMSFAQKQPLYSLAQSPQQYIHHRRNPSAPVVHVQPTRTPGLLSLSKPPRQAKASPRPKPAVATHRSPKPSPAQAAERGRQQASHSNSHNNNSTSINPSNNKRRSASQTAPARRRQPSPDPFAPAASPPNSNKRRHPNATNPIPVPPLLPVHSQNLSRSDPVLSHMPRRRQPPQRTTTLDSATYAPALAPSVFDEFPICDDMTDAGSRPSSPSPPSPTTARRPKPAFHLSEPRTPTRKSRLPDPPPDCAPL